MSLSTPEDSDPLLEFTTEPGGTAAKSPDSLLTRVEHLERALEESKRQAAEMKSELATLVRTVSDIRRPVGRPIAPATIAAKPAARAWRSGAAAAIVGLLIGASLGILGWMFLSGNSDLTIAPPTVAAQTVAPEPQAATPIEPETAAPETKSPEPKSLSATNAPQAPRARQAPQAPQAPRYVGTLSIDSDPGGDVFVNRESAGHTPLRLTNLRAGSHLIWIEREGYRRFTRVVQVPADRVSRLFAELEPLGSR